MPSVVVTWSGRCRDASVRADLCARLEELAQKLQSVFDEDSVAIRRFDEALHGTILLDAGLFEDGEAPASLDRVDDDLFRAKRLAVSGVEFSVPSLYPGDDRFSFVFGIDADPAVDGLLLHFREPMRPRLIHSVPFNAVETPSGTQITFMHDEVERAEAHARKSDHYLTAPRIHLRYNFEPWTDRLLGWVKRFYIPDLYYWHYEPLRGYDKLQRFDPAKRADRDVYFRALASPRWIFARD